MNEQQALKLKETLRDTAPPSAFVSSEEAWQLVLALSRRPGTDGFTEEEFIQAVSWVEKIRIDNAMLTLVLQGKAALMPSAIEGETSIMAL